MNLQLWLPLILTVKFLKTYEHGIENRTVRSGRISINFVYSKTWFREIKKVPEAPVPTVYNKFEIHSTQKGFPRSDKMSRIKDAINPLQLFADKRQFFNHNRQ